MTRYVHQQRFLLIVLATLILPPTVFGQKWQVVVNNGDVVPGDSRTFNSYNPPSVNTKDLVVFRARSKGGMTGQPAHGVYLRDMRSRSSAISIVFDRNTYVPWPSNLVPPTTFIEPPAFPRMDIWGDTLASRGMHPAVWQYEDTRAGTTGIYSLIGDALLTGVSNLGQVPEFDFFSVPGHLGTKFDVFPGAPAVTGNTIVFKGNYVVYEDEDTLPVSHTGVYYRQLESSPAGGFSPAVLIANSEETTIPGTDGILFGSTAPPSAAVSVGLSPALEPLPMAVFAGFDNEDNPTAGGIYLAPIGEETPPLLPLVEIGSQVPGEEPGTGFDRIGEGVSFDGRFVAFWGAWESETAVKNLTLLCPEEGNRDRIEYCRELYPDGFDTTVPVNQGIFVHDVVSGATRAVAKAPDDFDDFVYWNFSGRVPGTGHGDDDAELARWRSSAFVAVSGLVDGGHRDPRHHVAFKARTGMVESEERPFTYIDPIDGIYLKSEPGIPWFQTLAESGMDGTIFDPEAIDPEAVEDDSALPVTEMAIERDGFRGNTIVITVKMGTEEAGWAGVYLTYIRGIRPSIR